MHLDDRPTGQVARGRQEAARPGQAGALSGVDRPGRCEPVGPGAERVVYPLDARPRVDGERGRVGQDPKLLGARRGLLWPVEISIGRQAFDRS